MIVDIRALQVPQTNGVSYVLKYVNKPKQHDDPKELAHYLYMLIGFADSAPTESSMTRLLPQSVLHVRFVTVNSNSCS